MAGRADLRTRAGLLATIAIAVLLLAMLPGGIARAGVATEVPSAGGPSTSPLEITNFTIQPSSINISAPIFINVTATGGVPPYGYNYSGLPPGCFDNNAPKLECKPTEVDEFHIIVNVTDSNGSRVSAMASVHVGSGYAGPPVIQSVTVVPDPVAVDHVTVINITAYTTSSKAYFYFDLPPGCASFNATPLECLPTQPGSYYIGAQVTDGFGKVVQAHTWLNVTGSVATTGKTTGGLPTYVLVGVPVLVVVAAIALGVVLFRRANHRRDGPKGPSVPPKS